MKTCHVFTVVAAKILGGIPEPGAGIDATTRSQCLTDTFSVVGSGGATNSDIICGMNTGQHCKNTTSLFSYYWLNLEQPLNNLHKLNFI